ncbi:MAG TPA: zinc ribbon domain-containing protein [Terriglobales bacterium]|nr:zinc ribbon domain-containing protein [Terriglobales bacterium]
MFCTSCGNVIAPDQAICSKCGNPTSVGIMYGGTGRRVAEHYFVLGVVHVVYSCFIAIGGFVLMFVSKMVFPWIIASAHNSPPPPSFIGPLLHFIGWLLLIRAAAGIAAGIGLMQRAPWARMLALVVGFISLLSVPFGTALGIYTIWVLLSAGAEQEYNRLALQPH